MTSATVAEVEKSGTGSRIDTSGFHIGGIWDPKVRGELDLLIEAHWEIAVVVLMGGSYRNDLDSGFFTWVEESPYRVFGTDGANDYMILLSKQIVDLVISVHGADARRQFHLELPTWLMERIDLARSEMASISYLESFHDYWARNFLAQIQEEHLQRVLKLFDAEK